MNRRGVLSRTREDAGRRGQGLVEYAVTVPIFLMFLLGMLEFGFAFTHNLTLEYGTREGARVGSALANGSDTFACAPDVTGVSPVDKQIIAAVQRVLTSPGSRVDLSKLGEIHIYKSTSTGTEGIRNVWVVGNGPKLDPNDPASPNLLFRQVSVGWTACSRLNSATPDSVGVSLTYDYKYITPLGSLMGLGGSPTMKMSDRTVMALNPTN